jgi:hypothetical protein
VNNRAARNGFLDRDVDEDSRQLDEAMADDTKNMLDTLDPWTVKSAN